MIVNLLNIAAMHVRKIINHSTKKTFKERAAELFKQPESTHLGDCPICMSPLLLDMLHAGVLQQIDLRRLHLCQYVTRGGKEA
jgi:hypothetical protein